MILLFGSASTGRLEIADIPRAGGEKGRPEPEVLTRCVGSRCSLTKCCASGNDDYYYIITR